MVWRNWEQTMSENTGDKQTIDREQDKGVKETEQDTHQYSDSKSLYGFWIAAFGLGLAFALSFAMIVAGIRTASDLVAVIGAFTGVTGTLVAYFLGQKTGAEGKIQTEKKLSKTIDQLAEETNRNALMKGRLGIQSIIIDESKRAIEETSKNLAHIKRSVRSPPTPFGANLLSRSVDFTAGEKPDQDADLEGKLDEALERLRVTNSIFDLLEKFDEQER